MSSSLKGIFLPFRSIRKGDLINYVRSHYRAPRVVLAAAGGVNHDELVRLGEEHFGKLESTSPSDVPDLTPCRFTGSEIRIRDDDMPVAHIAIAIESTGWADADTIPLMVASTIVGNWDRFVHRVERDESIDESVSDRWPEEAMSPPVSANRR